MKLSDLLRAGKARIETDGWCQGDDEALFGERNKCCAATALIQVYPTISEENYQMCCRALDRLCRAAGVEPGGIADWNDAPERTLADVLAVYDKAIAAAEI